MWLIAILICSPRQYLVRCGVRERRCHAGRMYVTCIRIELWITLLILCYQAWQLRLEALDLLDVSVPVHTCFRNRRSWRHDVPVFFALYIAGNHKGKFSFDMFTHTRPTFQSPKWYDIFFRRMFIVISRCTYWCWWHPWFAFHSVGLTLSSDLGSRLILWVPFCVRWLITAMIHSG